jgi:hypothetical protein
VFLDTKTAGLLREHRQAQLRAQMAAPPGAWQDILARLLARHPRRRAKAALAAQSVDVVRNLHAATVARPRAPWH